MSWPGARYPGSGQPADSNTNPFSAFTLRPPLQPQPNLLVSVGGEPPLPAPFGTSPAQFPAAFPTAAPQLQPQLQPASSPATGVDNNPQMLLARAMSIPLATVLFQSLMGQQQPMFHPPPMSVPTAAPMQTPLMQPALLQMMQQAFQVVTDVSSF